MSSNHSHLRRRALVVALSSLVLSGAALAGDRVNVTGLSNNEPVDGFIVTYREGSASKASALNQQRALDQAASRVFGRTEPLTLKRFIYDLDVPVIVGGASTYTAALHLMRTGAAGVLVGFGGGAANTTRTSLGIHAPMATAVADVAGARRDYLDESGGRYVHVIADGSVGRSGDLVKAIACGADAVMLGAALARATEAPGRGWHWGSEAHHPDLPRGERVRVGTVGTLREILHGPGGRADGTLNLIGALRKSMATTGFSDVKEFQRVEVVVSPYNPR